ncbi:hypothetical protein DFS34DRAFT_689141 [Phlyctochytrium arcticum]|nr:hypothetical protein DFS34DRAFT_689141 [Phlyctochytrium arcticum]
MTVGGKAMNHTLYHFTTFKILPHLISHISTQSPYTKANKPMSLTTTTTRLLRPSLRTLSQTPTPARRYTTQQKPSSSDPLPTSSGIYDKDQDPMLKLSESERETIRKDIRTESARAFGVSYGIIGGAMALVGGLIWWNYDGRKK